MLYNSIKHCKSNNVNKKNQRKENKLRGIKEDWQSSFWQMGKV